MDARFQSQEMDPVFARMLCNPFEDHLRQPQPAKLWTHIHALYFSIFPVEELHTAACCRYTVLPHHEEGHLELDQLFHAEAMAAFVRIELFELILQLVDQEDGVGVVRSFEGDG